MPPLGRGDGSAHAGRPAPDHQQIKRRLGLANLARPLIAGPRVAEALHRPHLEQVVEAPLGAGDTVHDVFLAARAGLLREIGIGDQRAAERHHVAEAIIYERPRPLWIVDPVARDHRYGNPFLDAAGQVREDAARHLGHDLGDLRLVPPHVDAEGVHTRRDQPGGILLKLQPGGAPLHELVAVHPDQQGEIISHAPANRPDYLQAETDAVLEAAAVGIAALVGERREELADQVAGAGKDLDRVEPRLLHASGRLGEALHDLADLVRLQLFRRFPGQARGDGRRRHRLLAPHQHGVVVASGVVQLHRGACPVFPDRRGEARQSGEVGILVGTDVPRVAGALVHRGVADRDHPCPAAGPLGVEIHQPVGDGVVACHVHMHGRHEDAVLHHHAVDRYRLK